VLTTPQVSRRSGRTRPSQNDILLKASRITTPEPLAANHGVAAMILKLATNDKASIWVNLSRILQMTLIDAQDGYAASQAERISESTSKSDIDLTIAALNEPLGHLLSFFMRRCPSRRVLPFSLTATFCPRISCRTAPTGRVPLGRPLGFPLWPFLNWVAFGGRP
jgi:hypothetical protein